MSGWVHHPRLAVVVLAAGASTRMGQPKALLTWEGQTFVRRCVDLGVSAAGPEAVAVVTGAVALPEEQTAPALQVHNSQWACGPLSSLQAGLRSSVVRPDVEGVLVLTVDRPHVRRSTIAFLVEVFTRQTLWVWQPWYDGRCGHPIILPRDCVDEVLQLPPQANLRDVLTKPQWLQVRNCFPVDDPAVRENLDTPEALAKARARWAKTVIAEREADGDGS